MPTPTQEPPLQCRFGNGVVSVLAAYAPGPGPGVVPTYYQGAPGYTTFAAGEPLPGVFLELRLPRTTFVAGAVIQVEIQVRNTSAAAVAVVPTVSPVADRQTGPGAPVQTDPRSFPSLVVHGLGFGGLIVPSGHTWSIPSIVQLPFGAAQPVHLHASVGLSTASPSTQIGSGPTVMADLPLQLTLATPAQELHLELQVDHRQWCLRATDATGATPAGPLFVRMDARGPNTYLEGGPASAGTAGTWGARWGPNAFPSNTAISASFWVGGPNDVTAFAQRTLAAGP